jgi:hypothetical protein
MPLYIHTDFQANAVQPVACLKAGWEVIKVQYWLFVGITLVAILIGNLAPLGILMAPMMCGIYLAVFRRMRGQRVEFNVLFKGFDFFGEGFIAMLLHLVPVVVVIIPFCVIFFLGIMVMAPNSRGGGSDPAGMGGLIILMVVLSLAMVVILLFVSVIFTFAYPLVVERKLSGVEAVKLSAKASLANFWGLFGLLLLNGLLALLGVLFCYVGALLVLPVSFAATACAYRQVFGLDAAPSPYPPPPPVSFV